MNYERLVNIWATTRESTTERSVRHTFYPGTYNGQTTTPHRSTQDWIVLTREMEGRNVMKEKDIFKDRNYQRMGGRLIELECSSHCGGTCKLRPVHGWWRRLFKFGCGNHEWVAESTKVSSILHLFCKYVAWIAFADNVDLMLQKLKRGRRVLAWMEFSQHASL